MTAAGRISTRYSMLTPKLLERLTNRAGLSSLFWLECDAQGRDSLRAFQAVQHLLVRFGVLHHDLRLTVHREHERVAGLLHALDVVSGVSLEVRERTNLSQIDHLALQIAGNPHAKSC